MVKRPGNYQEIVAFFFFGFSFSGRWWTGLAATAPPSAIQVLRRVGGLSDGGRLDRALGIRTGMLECAWVDARVGNVKK